VSYEHHESLKEDTVAELTKAEEAAQEAALKEASAKVEADEKAADEALENEDFDKDRALATIRKQRASEKSLKADLAKARSAEKELAEIRQTEDDAKKSSDEKLAEANARVSALESKLSTQAVRNDFLVEAGDRYDDLELAYIAAERAGALGAVNPETGEISLPDFDKLDEAYPGLGGEIPKPKATGDAGIRSRGKSRSVGSAFNDAIRSAR
jgi:chromosome segregation ATPase